MGRFLDRFTSKWVEERTGILPRNCYISNKTIWPFTKVYSRSKMIVYQDGIINKKEWALKDELIVAKLQGSEGI